MAVDCSLVDSEGASFNYHTLHNGGSPRESGFLMNKRALYEAGGVMVCSQKKACAIVSLGFFAIIAVAVIVAFTKPGCPEVTYTGEPPEGTDGYLGSKTTTLPTATNGEEFPWGDVRLPLYVRPLFYTLNLHPNITTGDVTGEIIIKLLAIEETRFIILHGYNLNVSFYTLHDKYNNEIDITGFLVYPKHQQLYLGLSETLRRGSNYTLEIRFSLVLKEGLNGFYLSSYKTPSGEKRYLASTHFEPTSARSAFPCFDEPQLKARFLISIIRELHHIALSNMPVSSNETIGNGLVKVTFEITVEMSTYLVAFVICDYDHISDVTESNITVSVYTPPVMISQASYALNISSRILDMYSSFFGVPYPLPKQDLIAIPDFSAGAMENWGLITYRETSLMFDPIHTSSIAQEGVAVVIAHELAHQWFGNLVTMSWWQDLWLNEGFASFMENIGTDFVEPGWAMEEQFIVEKVQPALGLDSLISSHPISTDVHDPSEIESIFDFVSYKKGASVIGMLESFIGRPVFTEGLQTYLNNNKYSIANTDDLWNALMSAALKYNQSLNIKAIMDTWTLQAGYPLVTLTYDDGNVTAIQSRFLVCEDNVTDPNKPLLPNEYKWHIALTYITNIDPNPDNMSIVWMNISDVKFEVPDGMTWIKANVGQYGFYRVNYDVKMWQTLIGLLKENHSFLSPADRSSLIDDIFSLVKSGHINATMALDLSLYLKKELDYAPWITALSHLFDWSELLFNYPVYTHFLKFINSLIQPYYTENGWNMTGTHLQKLLRVKILQAAVASNDNSAIQKAKQFFQEWRLKNVDVPPDLRFVVYRTGIRYGVEDDWWHCWKVYTSSVVSSEKKLMLQALAQTQNAWIMQQYVYHNSFNGLCRFHYFCCRYLEYTLVTNKVRPQDVLTVLREVSKNPSGRLAAWHIVKQHWKKIVNLFGHGSFTIGAIIKSVTSFFMSTFDLEEVQSFFDGHELGSGSHALAQALETIRLNIQFHKHNLNDIANWLESYNAVPTDEG